MPSETDGAGAGGRTLTPSREAGFKPAASASSATPAQDRHVETRSSYVDGTQPIEERNASPLVRAFTLIGVAIMGLIAFAGVALLATRMDRVWREWGIVDFLALGGAGLTLAIVAVVVWALHRVARRDTGAMPAVAGAMLLVLATRSAAVLLIDAPIVSDWREYHEAATAFATGEPVEGGRPLGYSMVLGLLYSVFGVHRAVPETLNVVLDLATAGLLYLVIRQASYPAAATVAVAIWALAPAQILMTPVVASEPMYTTVFVAAVWAATTAAHRAELRYAAAAGVLLGLSQYVRATTLALLPAFMALPVVAGLGWKRTGQIALVTALAVLLALSPVALHNVQRGHPSLSTSDWLGWQLFVGTNQRYDGIWNQQDQAAFNALPGDTIADRSAVAARLGMERITSDPAGFAALAVRKFRLMWGSDDYSIYYSVVRQDPPPPIDLIVAGLLLTSVFWAAVTAGCFIFLLKESRRLPPVALLVLMCVSILAIAHTFIEIQTRYHAFLTPLIGGLAAVTFADLLGRRARLSQRDQPPRQSRDPAQP